MDRAFMLGVFFIAFGFLGEFNDTKLTSADKKINNLQDDQVLTTMKIQALTRSCNILEARL